MRWFAFLVAASFWPVLLFAATPDAALPAGVKAVWDLDHAAREKTVTREAVCLNGLWRWQPRDLPSEPIPAGGWGYTKVPGPWPGSRGDYTWVETQTFYPPPTWDKDSLGKFKVAYYQREFSLPADWEGRRVALKMEYLYSAAEVFVDGTAMGKAFFPGGEVDISKACKPGAKHVLTLIVAAVPLGEETAYFAENGEGTKSKANVGLRGLCGDVFLIATPAKARIDDVKIETSVEKGELAVSAALGNLDPAAHYRLKAVVTDGGKAVHEFTGEPFGAADLKAGRVRVSSAWKPEKLWDLNMPQNLYDLQVSLMDDKNSPVDAMPAVRFGFREFKIDGRDFRLNGTRIHCFAVPLDSAQISAAASTYAGARETLKRLKSFGVNLVYTHNYGCLPGTNLGFTEILRAADDEGMLVSFSMPHVNSYDWKKPGEAWTKDYARHAEFYVRAAQNHPAVVAYAMNHNFCGYADEHNPDHMDGMRDQTGQIRQPDDRNAKLALRAEAIVKEMDATRVIYHHGGANLGQTFTLNIYLNQVPSQERCDWFEHWATDGIKPLFLAEYGTPSDIDWTTYRGWFRGERSWGNGAVTYEACFPEWGAQYRGDHAYDMTEKEKKNLRWEAKAWEKGKPWHRWDYPYNFPTYKLDIPNILDVMAMYIKDDWRAYRTWGVSAFNSWELDRMWTLRPGFSPKKKTLAVDWENLQRPGYSPDFIDRQFEQFEYAYEASDWVPTVAAKAIIRNNGPVLAYIGGAAEHFTVKDHNYLPGQKVEKQVIVINESRAAVTFDCQWTWKLPTPVSGKSTFTVETGEQKRVPIECELPAGLAPGTYELAMTVKPNIGATQEDTFTFHVMTPAPAVKMSGKIALFDPRGETAAILKQMAVAYTAVDAAADLSGYDILIVGKGALTLDGAAPDISRVADGLRVICFEQTAQVLEKRLGFHAEEFGLRQVFERLPDHPMLAGVSTETLADWRGQSTIMPRQLQYTFDKYKTPMIEWCGLTVSHPWRCGNYGNVASVLIEKPGRGDFLPIVDGGFSLQYSPLMEYRAGKGLVIFCQLDVTGRTVSDPAAQRIARNILGYVDHFKPAEGRKALYSGVKEGKEYLEKIGITAEDYTGGKLSEKDVLIVGPGGDRALKQSAGDIAAFLKSGGHLVAIGLNENEAAFLPFKVTMRNSEYITTVFPPFAADSPLAGVGSADVDNRDPRNLPLIASGAKIFGDGVLAQGENANVVFCQLAPWQFDYKKQYNLKRTYRRASFAVERILANAGVAAPTPLLSRFAKPVVAKGETRYLDGLYIDKPEEWDDPYRFFCW